jgi:DNA polymerase-3 subunit gamma/tau
VLTLKYRPQRYTDLVGQQHIVTVIKALLRRHFNGEGLPAGLLFAGSRGCGKTTSARIIAATLNCESEYVGNPQYDVEPCLECESCQSIRKSNSTFVYELDAASHRGVEDARQIKELTTFAHTGKVRVVILDEAHSLTNEAFQALLKQLEEPMPNVLYIFCTTEPEKFPDTILSRVMQFNFKEIVPDLIAARLQQIAINENIAVGDGKVLPAIAQKAQGAMRDAIMMMEQLSSFSSPISIVDFLEYYGLVGNEVGLKFIEFAKKADIQGAKDLISKNFRRSVDMNYFLDNFMTQTVTDGLYAKVLNPEHVTEMYKATVETKTRLKYMNAYTAATFLFSQLLRVYAFQGQQKSVVQTKQSLEELFS